MITNKVEEKNDIRPHKTLMPRSAPMAVLARGDKGLVENKRLFIAIVCIIVPFLRRIFSANCFVETTIASIEILNTRPEKGRLPVSSPVLREGILLHR